MWSGNVLFGSRCAARGKLDMPSFAKIRLDSETRYSPVKGLLTGPFNVTIVTVPFRCLFPVLFVEERWGRRYRFEHGFDHHCVHIRAFDEEGFYLGRVWFVDEFIGFVTKSRAEALKRTTITP